MSPPELLAVQRHYPASHTDGVDEGGTVTARPASETSPRSPTPQYEPRADAAQDIVYQTDRGGTILWVSHNVESLLGWRPVQLTGTQAVDLIHDDDRSRVAPVRARVYEGTAVDAVSCRFRTAAGGHREFSVRAQPMYDADDAIVGSVVVLRDMHHSAATLRALVTLSRGNGVLVRAEDESQLLQEMCATVVDAGHYRFAWYGRPVEDPEQSVAVVAVAGDHDDYLDGIRISWGDNEFGRGPTGSAIRTGSTRVVNDFLVDPDYAPWVDAALQHGFRCSISLPVVVDGRVDGALMVYAAETGSFDDMARSLLEDLAADLGYGLARLRDAAHLAEALSSSVFVLAAAVESRDPYTAGHQSRVGEMCEAIGRELGLDDDRLRGLALGAAIHDLGKIAIPEETLVTQERLTDEQWAQLKEHPETGYRIVGRFPWPWPIADMIRQHHERIDGSGYPLGLRGDEILLEARIIAVADTYEAMAHDRPYRKAPGSEKARAVLAEGRARLYDPEVIDAFERILAAGFTFVSAPDPT
jgi:PAS domain S-box-containing protein